MLCDQGNVLLANLRIMQCVTPKKDFKLLPVLSNIPEVLSHKHEQLQSPALQALISAAVFRLCNADALGRIVPATDSATDKKNKVIAIVDGIQARLVGV